MLIGEDFLKAEHNYRGNVLRDQYQKANAGSNRGFVKAAAVIVLASIVIAACALPTENQFGAHTVTAQSVNDNAPSWEPYELPESIVTAEPEASGGAAAAEVVFGAPRIRNVEPSGQPNRALLEDLLGPQPEVQSIGNTEPTGEPYHAPAPTVTEISGPQ